jgi:hypothetical protein
VGACLEIGTTEVAFSERERNLAEPALFPLFGLCQPEDPALGIQGCALPANKFLVWNFRAKRRGFAAQESDNHGGGGCYFPEIPGISTAGNFR